MSDFKPTDEQLAALDAYATGENLIIEAAAGAGKTATLKLLAEAHPDRSVQYLAFNRAIVQEAQERMPGNVKAQTIHSLAFRAVGWQYKHRLDSWRMRSEDIARRLGIEKMGVTVDGGLKVLGAGYLAGLVMRGITIFCQSADDEPSGWHIPYVQGIDMPIDGRRTFENNRLLRTHLEPFMAAAWEDLLSPNGQLPFRHEHYLKLYQLSDPYIPVDAVLLDEGQDISPVMDSIFQNQRHAQLVVVGDSSQSIYGFSGAEDSIAKMIAADPGVTRTTLSQSWRFGQSVADVANRVLELLPTDMVVRGNPGLASTVGDVADPHVILTRTNAAAVNALLRGQREGRRAHLVGGGDQVLFFAQGAQALQTGGNTSHPDLACFDNWGAVQEYVKLDMQGDELRLLVSLVDDFGAATIIHALGSMPDERHADLVISTAHKAKGRQWETVQLAGDFPAEIESMSDEELRLLYVAVTRAQMRLDAEAVPWVVGEMQTPPAPVQAAQEPASGLHPLWRKQPEMATGC